MKIPKKLNIAGLDWAMKCKDILGGSFTTDTMEIVIGTKNKEMVSMVFLHEILEVLMTTRRLRYECGEEFMFVMNHQQFEDMCRDLSYTLKPYLPSVGH